MKRPTAIPANPDKTQSLILDYHPTDLNTYINAERSNRFMAAKIKKRETEAVYWLAKQQLKPVTSKVKLSFYWYVENIKKDPDNIAFAKKFILDGLKEAGIIKNDGFKQIEGFSDSFIVNHDTQVIIDIQEI